VPLKGPTINDIFKLGGGRCRTPATPPRGPPLTSSLTSVVDAAGPTGSAPRGTPSTSSSSLMANAVGPACSAPKGPTIDIIFKLGGGHCWTCWQHPQGGRHRRRLQPRWWTLSDPPVAPPRGQPLTLSSNLMTDAVGRPSSASQGPSINVIFKLGGERCQTRRQHPSGARHRRHRQP
jgi:hypothetical protein